MKLWANNLCFSYDKIKYLFQNLTFGINTGEILAILGPNGVGKTTLLKNILNIYTPTLGDVSIDGVSISRMDKRSLFKMISLVPQHRNALNILKVIECVMIGRSAYIDLFKTPKKEDYDICYAALEMVGMLSYSERRCDTLSGGEYQLVLIARALAANPQFIILDEPESGLDFKNQLKVLNIMDRLKNENIGIIFNTHYPKHALQKADKVLILGKNKYYFGNTEEILNEKNIEEIFDVKVIINTMQVDNDIIKNVIPIKLKTDE